MSGIIYATRGSADTDSSRPDNPTHGILFQASSDFGLMAREAVNLKVYTYDFTSAIAEMVMGALTQLGKT